MGGLPSRCTASIPRECGGVSVFAKVREYASVSPASLLRILSPLSLAPLSPLSSSDYSLALFFFLLENDKKWGTEAGIVTVIFSGQRGIALFLETKVLCLKHHSQNCWISDVAWFGINSFPKHSPPPIMMWENRYSSSCVVSFNLRCFPEGTKAPVWPVDVSLSLSRVKGSKIFFFYKTVCRASLVILKGRYCLFHLTHASVVYDSSPGTFSRPHSPELALV